MNCYIYVNSYLVLSKFYQHLSVDGTVGFLGVGFVNSVFVETKS